MKIHRNINQGDPEWLKIRKWVITGTKLKSVMWWPAAQLTQHYELLSEMYIEEEKLSAWEIIERWNLLEPIAKAKYEELTWYKVEEVWFITKEDWHWLSPDGIIDMWYDEPVYTKAIEIKCPMWKNYIKYLLEDKIPDEYKPQVINYFIVIPDLEELDFIIYNPNVSIEIKDLHIITVTRQDLQKEIKNAESKLEEFKWNWDKLKNTLLKNKKWI